MNGLLMMLLVLVALFWIWRKARTTGAAGKDSLTGPNRYELSAIVSYVKERLHELSRSNGQEWGMSEEAWNRKAKARTELRQALRGCSYGDIQDKQYIKAFIRDMLAGDYGIAEQNIDRILPFQQRELLTVQDRFDIVLYLYKQRHGADALTQMVEDYSLDEPKPPKKSDGSPVYEVTGDDIDRVFFLEYRALTFQEKLDLVVQRVYQMYKGFSVVDELREMRIDGLSGGVRGIPGSYAEIVALDNTDSGSGWSYRAALGVDEDGEPITRAWDSVWMFYKGKSIRLAFLSFGSEAELKRVCQNIYNFNLPGQLSEVNGYKVNEMKDGSRIVVVRPPFAETWAFFVRKFDPLGASLEQLIQGEQAELPLGLLKYFMKGSRITSITGSQGSGKTTLLMAMVKHIYASYTLRVQEMSFELHLRRLYSGRNILSFRETDYVSGQAALDLQKKTDGTVHILGEVATDEVASWMVQMAQVASLFTLFTHHAKTFRDLIESLRNSLLKTGVFRDERIAEQQVASVIDFDIHLRRDITGRRYIERITECCRRGSEDEPSAAFHDLASAAIRKSNPVHPRGYEERVIMEYRNGRYVAVQPMTLESREAMAREMLPEDAAEFERFVGSYWGETVGA
ncbi:MAG: ATPase, T2SS/T4P/T4SS family [Paenibacillus sp.]|uniref:ATPase, T2SS/T4P/T4SS family n=1 Tax=Paenibacillus sp. TaxID=58172 RepID=UPI002904DD13|nr:ATPase, T2SS/T4P/T4SS family [Paenibacillus sp.]MDU2241992.1 ATPase, T2SS/T4P/T4SS family [Paenibacillus sp.]